MKIPYSFSNLINGRHYDNDQEQWTETPVETRIENLNKFKDFLLTTTRGNSKPAQAIKRLGLYNLPSNYDIFERLVISDRDNQPRYIAGQDQQAEMKIIKEIIQKEV